MMMMMNDDDEDTKREGLHYWLPLAKYPVSVLFQPNQPSGV